MHVFLKSLGDLFPSARLNQSVVFADYQRAMFLLLAQTLGFQRALRAVSTPKLKSVGYLAGFSVFQPTALAVGFLPRTSRTAFLHANIKGFSTISLILLCAGANRLCRSDQPRSRRIRSVGFARSQGTPPRADRNAPTLNPKAG